MTALSKRLKVLERNVPGDHSHLTGEQLNARMEGLRNEMTQAGYPIALSADLNKFAADLARVRTMIDRDYP